MSYLEISGRFFGDFRFHLEISGRISSFGDFVAFSWGEKITAMIMSTLNRFNDLEYYNECDAIPMVDAIDKCFESHKAKDENTFKDTIDLPGLASKSNPANYGK